jgi:hypothetical protein
MPNPSLAVNGRAVAGEVVFVFLERSSLLGRWRPPAVGRSGEWGSFFTMIFGGLAAFRDLRKGGKKEG